MQETFSDGDFTASPPWTGSVTDFVVRDGALWLDAAPDAGSAFLTTPGDVVSGSWEFRVHLGFNPSAANFARIYVKSASPDLNTEPAGYFVMIGGADDEVALYSRDASGTVKIIDGIDRRVDVASTTIVVKVSLTPSGEWRLMTRMDTEPEFQLEGVANHTGNGNAGYFGIQCIFTSTRADRFSFDDIIISGEDAADTSPPTIEQAQITTPRTVRITFSEPIDPQSATTPANYEFSDGIGIPSEAVLVSDHLAELSFDKDFARGISYQLTVTSVRDLAGNVMAPTSYTMLFGTPEEAVFKDVIITEILADPAPSVGLPDLEFIEIYNRSAKVIQLDGWTIGDASSNGSLGNYVLPPGAYVTLAGSGAEEFQPYGNVVKVSGFPSLNNAGDMLVLRSQIGEPIDSVHYGDWYRDTAKQSGGWSLELIDPQNICAESENWAASESPLGGTPGQQNSILAEKPDLTGPQLLEAFAQSDNVIALHFDERLSGDPIETTSIAFTNNLIADQAHLEPDLRTVRVTTTTHLEPGILYRVVAQRIYDCPGNLIQDEFNAAEFALPEAADSLDVVVNEILFNPRAGGVDFVEIINRSSKYIGLASWRIANVKEGSLADATTLEEDFHLLKPGEIRAFTPSVTIMENEYPFPGTRNLVAMKLPSFNDDAGSVAIVDPHGKIIDVFNYNEDMHSGFVRDPGGVSLERLSSEHGTNDASNWKSAASHVGFATPGYTNSNLLREAGKSDHVHVDPEAFIPVTGQPDFTIISYDFQSPGMLGNLTILDSRGRVVRRLAQNSLLGSHGFFRWDGETDEGGKARIGIYMIRFDIYDETGLQELILKRVAIAGRF